MKVRHAALLELVAYLSSAEVAFPFILLTFSDARHSSTPCSISLSTSTRFRFSFGFYSTYIQLPLPIHIPFCSDIALHFTPRPLFSPLGSVTHILTRSYIAASRLRSYTDIGLTFFWKWRYQQWPARSIRFPASFRVFAIYLLVSLICRSM